MEILLFIKIKCYYKLNGENLEIYILIKLISFKFLNNNYCILIYLIII